MRKVIAIGEAGYDIIFSDGSPIAAHPGGRILNAAASLAKAGVPTTFVGECGADYFGDLIASHLQRCGVDTRPLDRFTEGTTATTIVAPAQRIDYGSYPDDRFNVVWPRIDEDDILLFGSRIAVDPAVRTRLFEIVRFAKERKAIVAYLPGFAIDKSFRLTRIMTALLENLEVADLVFSNPRDIAALFQSTDDAEAYSEHIQFYCPNHIHVAADRTVNFHQPTGGIVMPCDEKEEPRSPLGWRAGFVAGAIAGIFKAGVTAATVRSLTPEQQHAIVREAFRFADSAGRSQSNVVEDSFNTK